MPSTSVQLQSYAEPQSFSSLLLVVRTEEMEVIVFPRPRGPQHSRAQGVYVSRLTGRKGDQGEAGVGEGPSVRAMRLVSARCWQKLK